MEMKLTQKEAQLLQELKGQEKLCAEKYRKHAAAALDGQLKKMFQQLAEGEEQHLQILEQMEQGTAPQMQQGGGQQPAFTATYGIADTPEKEADCYLCTDVLAGEKHASHLYDACVFEFRDKALRQTLNQIQTQEQGHGKMIYDYMKTNAMYG